MYEIGFKSFCKYKEKKKTANRKFTKGYNGKNFTYGS